MRRRGAVSTCALLRGSCSGLVRRVQPPCLCPPLTAALCGSPRRSGFREASPGIFQGRAMRYMIGSDSLPSFLTVQEEIPDAGMLLYPKSWRAPAGVYACDNGVYGAFQKGKVWDDQMHHAFLGMLNKIPADNPPLWVLLPDAVADWPRTVELAAMYLPLVRQRRLPVAIALQDGCNFEEVMGFAPDWVFVAGSTEWKEANILTACRFFHARGIKVHVGRVNTRRRLMLCQSAGADSADGTTLNKFLNATLPLIANTLRQPCLIFGQE